MYTSSENAGFVDSLNNCIDHGLATCNLQSVLVVHLVQYKLQRGFRSLVLQWIPWKGCTTFSRATLVILSKFCGHSSVLELVVKFRYSLQLFFCWQRVMFATFSFSNLFRY